jgi:hypothetical protein
MGKYADGILTIFFRPTRGFLITILIIILAKLFEEFFQVGKIIKRTKSFYKKKFIIENKLFAPLLTSM